MKTGSTSHDDYTVTYSFTRDGQPVGDPVISFGDEPDVECGPNLSAAILTELAMRPALAEQLIAAAWADADDDLDDSGCDEARMCGGGL